MQVTPPTIQLQPITPSTNTGSVEANSAKIEAEQQFLAQVLKILTKTGMADVKILSSQQIIQVQPSIPLKPGQLVLVTQNSEGIGLQTDPKQAANQLLKLLIPQQGTVKDALSSILRYLAPAKGAALHPDSATSTTSTTSTKTRASAGSPAQLSTNETLKALEVFTKNNIDELVQRVISQLPSRQDIVKPELLKLFIQNSGLLNLPEPNSRPAPAANQAMQTLPLGQLLLPLLKSLLGQQKLTAMSKATPGASDPSGIQAPRVAEALARVMLNQIKPINLANLDDIDVRRTEIVARSDNQLDGFQIDITPPRKEPENDPKNASNKSAAGSFEKKWTVRLSFEFPELGKITAFIILAPEKSIEMNFWSERPQTFALICSLKKKLQHKLHKRLKSQGIDEFKIEVFEGEVPRQQPLLASHLINEIA